MTTNKRVLVTGGGTFLGDNIAAALLAEGAQVTLLVRPGAEDKLGALAQRVRWQTADVWEPSSLKGRARGHNSVIHTVGSLTADPTQGLTYQWSNFVSARNVANMCVSGGVSHMVLLSGVRAPWVSGGYLSAKREAEEYIDRVGLHATIIRAPIVYVRGTKRHPFYRLMTLLGILPPFAWLGFRRIAPMPVDVLARGVARITLDPDAKKRIYYASDLRRRNTRRELREGIAFKPNDMDQQMRPANPVELLDEDIPFGWMPPPE
ncbi:MAG TPA: NAD(P)H-binding protein [Oceanobacillus sp.]|nr:NAD(P)H-binding protein [Oceanobacillus sp.]